MRERSLLVVAGEVSGDIHAGNMLAVIRHDLSHIYGTLHLAAFEENLAGEWRKARKPERILGWVERYHRFNRG